MLSLLFLTVAPDVDAQATHGYADSAGVKIHYAALGDPAKPLIIFIHGFPDYWYTWREQMKVLSKDYYCVAIDQRGYNLSDKPKGGDNYQMKYLIADVIAVIKHLKRREGHRRWPRLGRCSRMGSGHQCPTVCREADHPEPAPSSWCSAGVGEQSGSTEEQCLCQAVSEGRDAHKLLMPEMLASWVKDKDAKQKYVEAFKRSDIECMLHYYKQNYPKEPMLEGTNSP